MDIPGIDTSVLEALLDLAARQRQLEDLRERAESRRAAVTPAVYQRVVGDYQSRLATLGAEAAPLKRRVSAEYQKLREMVDRLQQRLDAANLDKEELEFRRDLGEMEPAEFDRKVGEPAGIIEECQRELDVLLGHSARFLEALGPDEPLAASVPEPEPEPEPESEPAIVTAPLETTEVDASLLPDTVAEPEILDATAIVVTDPTPTDPDATIIGSPELLASDLLAHAGAQSQTQAPLQTSEASVADFGEGETQAVPQAMLTLEEGGERTQFVVGVLSYIGRSEGNQVQLARAGVSRRHALISLGSDGHYIIKDLQSQNGTFLNGDRVTEGRLNDGDRITVGDAEVIFRLPAS